jgi:hypothetical protein
MNIRDRLMSRASVAAMAAFAPKKEGEADTSKVGQPENVDAAGAGGGDTADHDDLGLSAEEQAQFDAMQAGRQPGEPGSKEDIEADGGSGDGEDDAAAEGDAGEAGEAGEASDAEPAEAAMDGADGAADGAKKPKTISYGKYQREQQKQQKRFDDLQKQLDAARGETAKEREARTRLDERTNLLLEAIQTKAPAAAEKKDDDPEPDGEADPIGHLQWQNRQLAKRVEDLTAGTQRQQQETAQQQQERQLYEAYAGDLENAARADASFADAFVHLRETRYRELGFIYAGIDVNDPAQCAQLSPEDQAALSQNIQRTFHNEQMMVAREAIKVRKSPAQVVRNLALARGFQPKAKEAAADDGGTAVAAASKVANGGARKAPPADAGSVKDQLQAIREGQGAAKSLSDGGGSPGGSITPQRLAEMSDDEFLELYENMPKRKLDSLMGKPANS